MVKVTCAILEQHERVLATQRSYTMSQPLHWELAGTKLETACAAEETLVHAFKKELNIDVVALQRSHALRYTLGNKKFEVLLFICKYKSGFIHLTQHRAYQWIELSALEKYNWCTADKLILNEYIRLKQRAVD